MKITYKNYPTLALLEREQVAGKGVRVHFDEKDKVDIPMFRDVFLPALPGFLSGIDEKNIIKPSHSFVQASWEASKKMVLDDEKQFAEALANKSGVLLLAEQTIFYSTKITPAGNIATEFVCFFHETLVTFSLQLGDLANQHNIWFSNCLTYDMLPESLQSHAAYYTYLRYLIMSVLLFKEYAEVETKLLPAGKKIKEISCQHKNETKQDVTLLDSRWFTTLVKSDGFKVRGHFRFQACGKGMKDRKIIWIPDFQKTGYTAPARKLAQEA